MSEAFGGLATIAKQMLFSPISSECSGLRECIVKRSGTLPIHAITNSGAIRTIWVDSSTSAPFSRKMLSASESMNLMPNSAITRRLVWWICST